MTRATSTDDRQLVAQVREGCRASFDTLYSRHVSPLYRYAVAISGRPAVAEEALQEAFLHLFDRADEFDPHRSPSVRGWLYGVLRNKLRPRLQDSAAELTFEAMANGGCAEEALSTAQSLRALNVALMRLDLAQREALVLCALQDVSYEDAAVILGVPVGTVRSRISRARAMLKDQVRSGDD